MVPPEAVHVIAALLDPVTAAINCCFCPGCNVLVRGEMEIVAVGGALPLVTLPLSNTETTQVDQRDPVVQVAGNELRLFWRPASEWQLPMRSRKRTAPSTPSSASQ